MNYRPDISDAWRRSAAFVDKILNGAMPVISYQTAHSFKLVVNVKTAKALGIDVPFSILAGADELIE
jgi:putative ABC transport system substrate-binding protein